MRYRLRRNGLYDGEEGSYKFRWKDVLRWIIHLPIGAVSMYFILHPGMPADWRYTVAGVIIAFFFLAYEVLEDIRVRDWSFKDVFGVLIAMIATALVIRIWF